MSHSWTLRVLATIVAVLLGVVAGEIHDSSTMSLTTCASTVQVSSSSATTVRASTTTVPTLYSTVTGSVALCTVDARGKNITNHQPRHDLSGDGSPPRWPTVDMWATYDSLRRLNSVGTACRWGNMTMPANSADETSALYSAIDSVSSKTCVDRRFILAIILQESSGCVRAPTTGGGAGSISNPGIMQSYNGSGSCYQLGVQNQSCPATTIFQMVYDGVTGGMADADQNNLVTALNTVQAVDRVNESQAYYHAAMFYNAGPYANRTVLNLYVSYIANRLTGAVW